MACQRCHERPAGITHDLGQFDQATLGILPGEEHDQPVLQQHADQLGIQFTPHAPRIGRVPLIHLAVLFPQFVQQFRLPAFAQQHQSFLKAQALRWISVTRIGQSASCKVSSLMVCRRRCASRSKSSRRLSTALSVTHTSRSSAVEARSSRLACGCC
jgi:hypothetical protein